MFISTLFGSIVQELHSVKVKLWFLCILAVIAGLHDLYSICRESTGLLATVNAKVNLFYNKK